ncbi:glucosylglycerol-phosphate synthase [Synechococcus sp. CBW1107]|uniref:glucosylglycerol-phosphate synthase n=1 Tax=Synechococcus sp. CBW1107 TaxID=2789857 RepID=UPI002AD5392F|nr:glucosylglycerol-phosphate synthase [Synechococcus sp. CBW1107]CAK6700828.1 Glucosylglycerol-phosphate synthase [Synechococcus sp. CBW1107]
MTVLDSARHPANPASEGSSPSGSTYASGGINGQSDFVLVYHRSPYDEQIDADGTRHWVDQTSPNGIIPTLRNLFREQPRGTWIAWRKEADEGVVVSDERLQIRASVNITLRRLPLTEAQISSFYHVTSKESFWPILHSFPGYFSVDNSDWQIFEQVNASFARAACEEAAPGATIWVHDYNLWLAPAFIRRQRPDVRIAFFHHTPFPSCDVFSILPWRDAIVDSLLCCDLVGFHIPRYANNFAHAAISLRGATAGAAVAVEDKFRRTGSALAEPMAIPWLEHQGRQVRLVSSPVGTSPDLIRALADKPAVQATARTIAEQHEGRTLILSASRVDYTKGNEEMLLTYERLLECQPDWHGRVELFLACVAAASGMRIYDEIQRSVEEVVGRINGRFGRIDWTPVRLSTVRTPYEELVAWFGQADICWITPLRDGLNLVAKEYVAARRGQAGVLVLSEFSGASVELQDALLTNPYSHRSMDEAIAAALVMPFEEQRRRMDGMTGAVETFTVQHWAEEQLGVLRAL